MHTEECPGSELILAIDTLYLMVQYAVSKLSQPFVTLHITRVC